MLQTSFSLNNHLFFSWLEIQSLLFVFALWLFVDSVPFKILNAPVLRHQPLALMIT